MRARQVTSEPVSQDAHAKAAISARRLTKVYGRTRAVEGLDFEVGWGTVTGFLGPNGAGKTTTMRMALGLVAPTEGDVAIMGRRYEALDRPAMHVGAALDNTAFHPKRTGRNHLRALAAAAGIDDARVDDVLRLVELTDAADRKVGAYSLGMRQRLGLAAALLGDPVVLVLDEPANGLDPQGIRWLRGFLRAFAERGKAVFVSSHLLGEIAQIADEVIVINRGRLVVQAPVEALIAGSAHVVRVRTPQATNMLRALKAESIDAVLDGPETIVVRAAGPERVGEIAAAAGVPVHGLESDAQSLEEIFIDLIDKEGSR